MKIQNWIGGALVPPASGLYLDNSNPATGEIHSFVPDSDERDVERAVAAASAAFPAWASTPVEERSSMLRRIASLIRTRMSEFSLAEANDTGKPLALATRLDIPRSARNFEFFADAITQASSECHPVGRDSLNYTLRDPLGVVACISPWNLPLYLLSWKIAPALAAGNCVVAKPSEITPMTAFLLSEVCQSAGLPSGVLNLVHGLGPKLGPALCTHPLIKAVSFTGSTATGAKIASLASPLFKKVSLEMGGKNAFVVFMDADLEKAAQVALRAAFTNQGEICLCGSRFLIERSIYEPFKRRVMEATRKLRQGDPLELGTEQGALVSQGHFEKVLGYLKTVERDGGRILVGGKPARLQGRCSRGWFIEPTWIEGLPPESPINQEEVFGPVASLIPFDTEEEALRIANSTRYGLSASVFTENLGRAHRFAGGLQAGIVWVNGWMTRDLRTPFGGVKDSGVGREGGWEALRFFTEPKNICIQLS